MHLLAVFEVPSFHCPLHTFSQGVKLTVVAVVTIASVASITAVVAAPSVAAPQATQQPKCLGA